MSEDINEILKKIDTFSEKNQLTELDIEEMRMMQEKLLIAKEELVKNISNEIFYVEE